MKSTMQLSSLRLLVFFTLSIITIPLLAQTDMMDDGEPHTINYATDTEFHDYKVPTNTTYTAIRFIVAGGDGGYSQVYDCTSPGGEAARVQMIVPIGTSTGEIAPGSNVRFIPGQHGQSKIKANTIYGCAVGAGGGGSGLCAQINDSWKLFAVAGGGGGAHQESIFTGCINGDAGHGGRSSENGSNGQGWTSTDGGAGGYASTDNGGAAGAFHGVKDGIIEYNSEDQYYYWPKAGWRDGPYSGTPTGGRGGRRTQGELGSSLDPVGGFGFGGGGGGIHGYAGGGGGYGGGGQGGAASRAGGGGSYLNRNYHIGQIYSGGYTTKDSIIAGGSVYDEDDGYISYEFICIPRITGITELSTPYCTDHTAAIIQLNITSCTPDEYTDFMQTPAWGGANSTGVFGIAYPLRPGETSKFYLRYNGIRVDSIEYTPSTVVDITAPTASCSNLAIDMSAGSQIITAESLMTATDECTLTYAFSDNSTTKTFGCNDIGVYTETITVSDVAGNTNTCQATITVTPDYPTSGFNSQAETVYLGQDGLVNLTLDDFHLGTIPSTNCFTSAEVLANYSVPTLDCDDIGTQSIPLDKVDNNFPDVSVVVTVIDDVPITATVTDVILNLGADGTATLLKPNLNFTVNDNCYTDAEILAVYSIPQAYTSYDCSDIGNVFFDLDKNNSNFPNVRVTVTVQSSTLSFPAVATDFCSNTSFDLTSLEDGITTAEGIFSYTQTIERLYIPNLSDNTVSVIDLNTNTVIATIPVGLEPYGVAVRPDGKEVYVANSESDNISVIDVLSNTVVATIAVGNFPFGITFTSDGSKAYIVNARDDNVSVIDVSTRLVVGSTISVGSFPLGIVLSPDDSKIYVTNYSSNTVSIINVSNNSVSNIAVKTRPLGVAISADGTKVYVTNELGDVIGKGALSIIDISTNTIVETLDQTEQNLKALAVSPTGDFYMVDGNWTGGIIEVDPGYQISTHSVEDGIMNSFYGVDINEDGSQLFLPDGINGKMILYSTLTHSVITTIAVGNRPYGFGNFYVKTTLEIADPTAYASSQGDIVNVVFDGGGDCAATTTITFGNTLNCVELAVKVLLQGPYDSNSENMASNLSTANLLPSTLDGYTMLSSATANTGTEAIVDWVTIELRDPTDDTFVLATRPALVQADGDVVDMDGSSAVQFSGISANSAYVVVRHRNHLGVMTAAPVSFD